MFNETLWGQIVKLNRLLRIAVNDFIIMTNIRSVETAYRKCILINFFLFCIKFDVFLLEYYFKRNSD